MSKVKPSNSWETVLVLSIGSGFLTAEEHLASNDDNKYIIGYGIDACTTLQLGNAGEKRRKQSMATSTQRCEEHTLWVCPCHRGGE